jgi:hypothetical protein
MTTSDRDDAKPRTFVEEAQGRPPGILSEFAHFLRHNKKWWLTPIVVMLLVIGAVIVLGGTAAAPFIYPLF